MSRTRILFRPPRVAISSEVRWIFLRAFGPTGTPFSNPVEPERAVELARLFEISPRIAVRQGQDFLGRDLGEHCAAQLMEDVRHATFVVLRRIAAARDLAQRAAHLDIKLVFLKFLALHYSNTIPAGSREAADVDILAPPNELARLHEVLLDAGYQARDLSASEHHLPILDHPNYGPVEIHHCIPGIVGDRDSYATVESLHRESALRRIAELPGDCNVPIPEVQAAHTITHGVVQHGSHPDAYAAARMLADLIDIREASGMGADVFRRAQDWLGSTVREEETLALRDLCESLKRGEFPANSTPINHTPESAFLRHILAGVLDADYKNALNLRFFDPRLTDRPQTVARGALLKRAIFPTRGEIDEIYGRPTNAAGYLARRLLRPLDLLGRLFGYAANLARLKARELRHRRH